MEPPPPFRQFVPRNGRWELDQPYSKRDAQLVYRHEDTGEKIAVPSVWYNQPVEVRIGAMRWYAERDDERAQRLRDDTFNKWAPSEVERAEAQATRLRALAEEMERTGKVRA